MPNPGMSTTGNAQVCMYFSVAVLHSLRHPTNDTTDHEYQSKSCLYFGLIVVTDMSAAMQERGDGTWTCVLCASDGPGKQLSCEAKCRACDACYFKENARDRAGDTAHKCCRTAEEFRSALEPGHQVVSLPDMGLGRERWTELGKTWQLGGLFSAASHEALNELWQNLRKEQRSDQGGV